jgi:hypothetical protein
MGSTLRVVQTAQVDGVNVVSAEWSATAGMLVKVQQEIAATTDDFGIEFPVDISATKGIYLMSDADVVIETNSTSAPQETITLKAGVAVAWKYGASPGSAPFSGDVTMLYVSNAGAAAANLTAIAVIDPTA